jgi:hypothetical protein
MSGNLDSPSESTVSPEKLSPQNGEMKPEEFSASMRWVRFATLGLGLVLTYFLVVFLYAEAIFGFRVQLSHLALTVIFISGNLYWIGRWACKKHLVSASWLKDLAFSCMATLLSLVGVDIGFSFYHNIKNSHSVSADGEFERSGDRHTWAGEVSPRRFYPTEKNFALYKPNVTISGEVYGSFYYKMLMESPTVVDSVLQFRHISYSIDEHGFRETTPLDQAHIFALGDSYTFGWAISQEKTWVKRLEEEIGEPVYNLGISDCSPKQELMLLEYMLQMTPDRIAIRHLLWMIYEANDLEDSYETFRPPQTQENNSFEYLFVGTIVGTLNSIPLTIKEQSVINRLRTGQIAFALPFKHTNRTDPFVVDGIRLVYPLYHSDRYGCSFFAADEVDYAGRNESYVAKHPNRPFLDQTFKDMATLSRKYKFEVTVVIAPSGPRLYAPYFANFPPTSEKPYFINYVETLSSNLGFGVINLYRLMQPYAAKEFLYWRDDEHWNERGQQVVAEIVAKQLTENLVFEGNSHEAHPSSDGSPGMNISPVSHLVERSH